MPRKKIDYYAAKVVRGDDEIIVAAWDVETQGLGGKLLMIQWGVFGEVTLDDSPEMVTNFINAICEYPSPVIWYAHFAQYDWRYVMDTLVDMGLDIEVGMRTDNDVYEIRLKVTDKKGKRKTVIMRDSYALWNSPLEKLAKSFCPEIPKLEIDIENFDPKNPAHREYAKRDVQILLAGLPRLNSMLYKHFGVNPNATTASTALKGWQISLPKDTVYSASKYNEQELFVRQAYYGGLVFLTNTNLQKNCKTFDLNSSYPASMMKYGVPYGRCANTTDYNDARMGIYRVRVRTPEDLVVPIIPARDAKGSMRWYRGEFDTVCTNRELIFAAQNGYEILEVYEGLVWEETIFPFNSFIEKCKAIRFAFPGQAEELVAKLMQNSLYGKFGSRRERFSLTAAHMMTHEEMAESEPWDTAGKWYVKRSELDEEMRCMPVWATFITAHSRLRLLQAVYTVGVENAIYGDTDSITIKDGHSDGMDVGTEYGQWKLEKEWSEFRAIAPKVYSGILTNGKRVGAAKGLPRKNLNDGHWKSLLEDGTATAHALSLNSLRVTLKTGVKPAHTLLRKSSTLTNSTNFIELPNGQVRARIAA